MKNILKITRRLVLTLGLVMLAGGVLIPIEQAAAAGCAAKASQVAAASGARVLSVQSIVQGGRKMCRITVLITPKSGPARRRTITVPQ